MALKQIFLVHLPNLGSVEQELDREMRTDIPCSPNENRTHPPTPTNP